MWKVGVEWMGVFPRGHIYDWNDAGVVGIRGCHARDVRERWTEGYVWECAE